MINHRNYLRLEDSAQYQLDKCRSILALGSQPWFVLEKAQSIAVVLRQVSTVAAHKSIIATNIIYYIIIRQIVNNF
jgi:hypothetical protein